MCRAPRLKLPPDTREALLREVNPTLDLDLSVDDCAIFSTRMKFYQHLRLYEIVDQRRRPHHTHFCLMGQGSIFVPDGTMIPISTANALEGLRLSRGHVRDYLQFCLRFLQSPALDLHPVEAFLDLTPLYPYSRAQKNGILAALHPLLIREMGGAYPGYMTEGLYRSGNILLRAQIRVNRRGDIRPVSRQDLLRDLPLGPANQSGTQIAA